jgi:hypothetical protein
MADKVTGNPYEHNPSHWCKTALEPCRYSGVPCNKCPNYEAVCTPDCLACIWEVAYRAGQKSGRQEVLKYFMHPGILRNSLHRVLEKYPQASGITLLIYCVEDIAENLNLEWGIV